MFLGETLQHPTAHCLRGANNRYRFAPPVNQVDVIPPDAVWCVDSDGRLSLPERIPIQFHSLADLHGAARKNLVMDFQHLEIVVRLAH